VIVERVELRRIAMPLVAPFRTAHGVEDVRDVLLVRVETAAGEGWGECAASRSRYRGEDVDSAHRALRERLVPSLFGRDVSQQAVDVEPQAPMARAALEMALLGAQLRAAGRSVAAWLGARHDAVPVRAVAGLEPSLDQLVAVVAGYVADGYTAVKLKIRPGNDVASVAAVRAAFPDLALHVDANGSYAGAGDDAWHALSELDELDVVMIEQPLAADDLDGHRQLAQRLRTPICLDESITSSAAAADALDMGACSVVCVKPGPLGGMAEAVGVRNVCVERGAPAWVGGMLETGVGRAAALALAAMPGFTLPADLSASRRYYERDITQPFELEGGCLRVPSGPGIGVVPDRDALDAVTTSVEILPAP
jgi:O-succinylbenzoate synthase